VLINTDCLYLKNVYWLKWNAIWLLFLYCHFSHTATGWLSLATAIIPLTKTCGVIAWWLYRGWLFFIDMLSCFMASSFLFFLWLFPEVGDITSQGGLRLIVVFHPGSLKCYPCFNLGVVCNIVWIFPIVSYSVFNSFSLFPTGLPRWTVWTVSKFPWACFCCFYAIASAIVVVDATVLFPPG